MIEVRARNDNSFLQHIEQLSEGKLLQIMRTLKFAAPNCCFGLPGGIEPCFRKYRGSEGHKREYSWGKEPQVSNSEGRFFSESLKL